MDREELELRDEQELAARQRLEQRINDLRYAIEHGLDYMEGRIEDPTLRGILRDALDEDAA